MISKKYLILGAIFGCIVLVVFLFTQPDGKLHVVFCNVGQGDAAYIRTPLGAQMVIDGGPDNSVLSCLGRHMPFWDRSIDVVMMTHPQKDHMYGLVALLQRYSVGYMIAGVEGGSILEYQQLLHTIADRHIFVKQVYEGDRFILGGIQARVIWPRQSWLEGLLADGELALPSGSGTVLSEGPAVLGYQTQRDLNDFCYYLQLTYGSFDALFTGDGDERIQPEILADHDLEPVEVLKVPHHGSRTGMLPEFLDRVHPDLAVISVGRNTYGHPAPETIKALSDRHVKILRTDKEGDVEVVSDGTKWWIR